MINCEPYELPTVTYSLQRHPLRIATESSPVRRYLIGDPELAFHLTYSGILQAVPAKSESKQNEFQKIDQTMPDQSFSDQSGLQEISAKLVSSFSLGWTHYVTLLTISNADERRFYEIEALFRFSECYASHSNFLTAQYNLYPAASDTQQPQLLLLHYVPHPLSKHLEMVNNDAQTGSREGCRKSGIAPQLYVMPLLYQNRFDII